MISQPNSDTHDDSYVIIGDGIAGSSAAEVLADRTADADITVLTAESEPLYNRILIKEYAKGTVPEKAVRIHDRAWYDERGIDLELDARVRTVETDNQAVLTEGGKRYQYDKLLVATGGSPRSLPVPNADADGITSFWTIEDARRIRQQAGEADSGTIIGGGLLGIDYAAIAATQDVDAHYLIREDRWFSRAMSETGAAIVHDALREKGVTPVLETAVERFETDDDGHVIGTVASDGQTYRSECVGVAIGTEPNTAFLSETPVTTDDGVVVDSRLRTDVSNIYAAGDVARYHDRRLEEPIQNGSWGSASAQGEHAAANMLAAPDAEEYFEFVPSYTVTHFEFPMASFGHPGLGETYRERRYGETEWRRLAFKDGMLVGGVLIGDLSPLQPLKQLTSSGRHIQDRAQQLLAPTFDGLETTGGPTPAVSD